MKLKNCKIGMKARVKNLSKVEGKSWWAVDDNIHCDEIVTIESTDYKDKWDIGVVTTGGMQVWLNHRALKKATPRFIKIINSPNSKEFVVGEVKAVFREKWQEKWLMLSCQTRVKHCTTCHFWVMEI